MYYVYNVMYSEFVYNGRVTKHAETKQRVALTVTDSFSYAIVEFAEYRIIDSEFCQFFCSCECKNA